MFLPTFMTSEHPGSQVFQQTRTIFLHEDSQVNIRKNALPTGGHVFQTTGTIFKLVQNIIGTKKNVFPPTRTIFELIQDIIGTNHLTKFHDDRTINVASNIGFTIAIYSHLRKNAPPLDSHVFQTNATIFELIQDIIQTNLLTKFHEDWTINVASRVLTRKSAPPTGGYVFFHRSIPFSNSSEISIKPMNTAPPPGGRVFQRTGTIFEFNQHII
ncbi:hypothetical protein DPMN_079611 [Dreissena polymorpha]|uniref:Uncharacterized protein n=1 Tax=Dreissena polymorpha TaxID=45954 RepID=A0A9D4BQ81_DREPO|nr:hypothetical protein DPMN_079611 [Dreissena polymorpha]